MTSRVFGIADLHIGHKKVIEFESEYRPFKTIKEHDEFLIDSINSKVTKRDVLWILGDVAFGRTALEKVALINGTKKLIMGNHDKYPAREYLKYFSQIFGSVKYRDCILTHIPIHPNQFVRYKFNIHGHLHHETLKDPRYICVSVEQTGLAPVLFDELIYLAETKNKAPQGGSTIK